MSQTQSAIKYEMDELPACKALLDQSAPDEPETLVNLAAISFKEVSTQRSASRVGHLVCAGAFAR
jgi:hypothetical protein